MQYRLNNDFYALAFWNTIPKKHENSSIHLFSFYHFDKFIR